MKQLFAVILFVLAVPFSAMAEEEKGFWASLVPDNSSAIEFVESSKSFFGQLFKDTKDTGSDLIEGGKNIIESTGDKVKSLTGNDE